MPSSRNLLAFGKASLLALETTRLPAVKSLALLAMTVPVASKCLRLPTNDPLMRPAMTMATCKSACLLMGEAVLSGATRCTTGYGSKLPPRASVGVAATGVSPRLGGRKAATAVAASTGEGTHLGSGMTTMTSTPTAGRKYRREAAAMAASAAAREDGSAAPATVAAATRKRGLAATSTTVVTTACECGWATTTTAAVRIATATAAVFAAGLRCCSACDRQRGDACCEE